MTRKINISGIIFHVEPLGYEILRAYMDAWDLGNPVYKALWEEQVAEYLLQKLDEGNKITTAEDVKGLNRVLKDVPFRIEHNGDNHKMKRSTARFNLGSYISQIAMGLW